MRFIGLILLFGLGFFTQSTAQSVEINEDPIITNMMERWIELNKARNNIDGWRIQILATTDRQRMERARQNFQYQYPNISVDWVHSKPYYKLRAGAFATRLDAVRLLNILKQDYPSAYLAKDSSIRPVELLGY